MAEYFIKRDEIDTCVFDIFSSGVRVGSIEFVDTAHDLFPEAAELEPGERCDVILPELVEE